MIRKTSKKVGGREFKLKPKNKPNLWAKKGMIKTNIAKTIQGILVIG